MKKVKSLNTKTVAEVKQEISKQMNCNVRNILLFGSRILGNPRIDSDLDVAICDRRRNIEIGKLKFKYINVFGINTEIYYVHDFEDSIYKYYSV